MFFGATSFGEQVKLCLLNGVAHHGQALIGAGACSPFICLNRRTRTTAVLSSLVPFFPSRLGLAADPTHRPISIGQSPSSGLPFCCHASSPRISSSAQTTPAA